VQGNRTALDSAPRWLSFFILSNRRCAEAQDGTPQPKVVLVKSASPRAELRRSAIFVVTEGVGDANSGGVLCSGPSSSAKRFTQWFIQQIGTFRSYGAKPRLAIDRYKHCIPTGFFVRLNNLRKKTKDIQTCYTEETKRICGRVMPVLGHGVLHTRFLSAALLRARRARRRTRSMM